MPYTTAVSRGIEMTIDLSQFVDKEVYIRFRNGTRKEVKLQKTMGDDGYPFYYYDQSQFFYYSQSGHYWHHPSPGPNDIVDIIENHQAKPMTESLKCETLKGITKSLLPELIPFVESHEKYAEVMYQIFVEFLQEKFGDMKPEVKGEIACMFMDSLYLRSV